MSLAYPSGEEGGNFLVQMISTCFSRVEEGGGVGGRHPVVPTLSVVFPESHENKLFFPYPSPDLVDP
jgi:hypothetical protein